MEGHACAVNFLSILRALFIQEYANNVGKVWWRPIMLVNYSIRELRHREPGHCKHESGYVAAVSCTSTLWWNNLPARWASTTLCQHDRTILDEQFAARSIGRRSPYITWPAKSPVLTSPDFFLWGFVEDYVYRTPWVIWQTYKEEFMLLSAMSHHRCFITHGSRLSTGWTFPMLLIEAMLRFMKHKAKKS